MADWYYLENREQKGPITEEQLRTLVSHGHLGPDHLVWSEGMAEWQAAKTVPGLEFRAPPPRASVFNRPQGAQQQEPEFVPIRNWLPWAIVATIFCCQVGGIISIVYAAKANSAASSGNSMAAQEAAGKAKFWFILSIVIGLVSTIAYVLVVGVGGAMKALEGVQ
jgi:hypothetical protein